MPDRPDHAVADLADRYVERHAQLDPCAATEEGVTGRSYLFCYLRAAAPAIVSLLGEIERLVKGERVAPAELWTKLSGRFTLIGVQGIVRMAMAGFDAAAGAAVSLGGGGGQVTAPSLTTVAPRTTSSSMSTTSWPSFFGHMSDRRCRRFVAYSWLDCVASRLARSVYPMIVTPCT